MQNILQILLTLILSTMISQAENEIHLELTPTTCLPGDLVELKATTTTPTYQEFTLSIPKNKNLQLIAKETTPVTLSDNQYTQTHLYILQAIAPGQHTLSNITATSNLTPNNTPLELNPLTLTVSTYDSLDQDLTPAPFPTKTANTPSNPYVWLLLIIPAFLCTYIIKTNKLKSTPPAEPTPTLSLNTLKTELTKGTIPETLCYQLLETPSNNLTETQRTLIEKALYNPTFSPTDLLNSLTKEDQP
ncbi:MAG: hypothetical protein ACSHX6_04535 [Akkermansiaceae bacterium]